MFALFAGRPKVQPILRANAVGGDFIRPRHGIWISRSLHSPSTEGDVEALQVSERRRGGAAQAQLQAAGRERCHCRHIRSHERRNTEAEVIRSEL